MHLFHDRSIHGCIHLPIRHASIYPHSILWHLSNPSSVHGRTRKEDVYAYTTNKRFGRMSLLSNGDHQKDVIWALTHPLIHPFIHLPIHPFIHPPIHQSFYPFTHAAMHAFIKPFIKTCKNIGGNQNIGVGARGVAFPSCWGHVPGLLPLPKSTHICVNP